MLGGVELLWCGRQNFLSAENFWEVVINELLPAVRWTEGRWQRLSFSLRQVFGGKCAVKQNAQTPKTSLSFETTNSTMR